VRPGAGPTVAPLLVERSGAMHAATGVVDGIRVSRSTPRGGRVRIGG